MPFQIGNQLAAKGKPIDAMIRSVLALDDRARLRKAIEAQLNKAAEGNLDSLDWLTCRLEGKAHQTQSVDVVKTEIKSFTINELAAIISERHEKLVNGVGEGAGVAIEGAVGTEGVGMLESPSTNNELNISPIQSAQLEAVQNEQG